MPTVSKSGSPNLLEPSGRAKDLHRDCSIFYIDERARQVLQFPFPYMTNRPTFKHLGWKLCKTVGLTILYKQLGTWYTVRMCVCCLYPPYMKLSWLNIKVLWFTVTIKHSNHPPVPSKSCNLHKGLLTIPTWYMLYVFTTQLLDTW